MSDDPPPPPMPRQRTCGAHTETPDGRITCREPGMWSAVVACPKEPHAVVYLCGWHRHTDLTVHCDHGIARVEYALLAGAA